MLFVLKQFTFVSRTTHLSLKRTIQWQTWSLDDWPSAARDNRSGRDNAPNGYMTVDFMANEGKHEYRERKRAVRGKSEVQHRRRLSEYGVRFGLYMLFLVAGDCSDRASDANYSESTSDSHIQNRIKIWSKQYLQITTSKRRKMLAWLLLILKKSLSSEMPQLRTVVWETSTSQYIF